MELCGSENARVPTRPPGFRGCGPTEGSKLGPEVAATNRRALRDIRNLVGAPPYPCAMSKRGLTGKNAAADDKNKLPPTCAAHRPITRRFAASLKSQSGSQNTNTSNDSHKLLGNTSSATWYSSSTAIDVDDYKSAGDSPLPIMVDEMEEAVEPAECGEHKEVEMEDLAVEEPVTDIDGYDRKNPLAVVEYLDDIYSFYRKTEVSGCVPPNYMSTQFDINDKMRAILIDWLIEVHYKFELMDETLFLTVNIIDRFLSRQSVVRKKLQLVGVTSMLLACKYEEVSVPVVEDLILISDRAYSKKEVLDMEKLIVNTLQFNMSVPTPYVFMRRFLKAAAHSDKKLELLSSFMVELALVEYEMLEFRPSMLAAAAVYTAQCALSGFGSWNRTSEVYTSYTEEELLGCSRKMVGFHRDAGVGKLTGVHRKYSTFKFGFAAKCEPALFLLDKRV